MFQEIIRGEFGQHYSFLPANAYSAKLDLAAKIFWDFEYTRQFVASLNTSPDYLAELLSHLGKSSGHTAQEKVDAISHALLNHQLHVYPVKPLQVGEASLADRTLELDNMIYQVRHPSVVLLHQPELKNFASKDEALAFIQQFDLDITTLSNLINEADWQSSTGGMDQGKQFEKLAELVLANKLVITKRSAPEPPKPESSSSGSTSNIGNRSAGLGPENNDEPTSPKTNTFKTQHEAALHVSKNINQTSINENREYGGMIYQNQDGTFSYTEPKQGTIDGVDPGGPASVPEGTKPVAYYHTHGGDDPQYDNENFSNIYDPIDKESYGDIPYADANKIDGYLATPKGKFKYYSHTNQKVETLGNL